VGHELHDGNGFNGKYRVHLKKLIEGWTRFFRVVDKFPESGRSQGAHGTAACF
jgi:hypothetical protein